MVRLMEPSELLQKATKYTQLFAELNLTTKIILGFLFALILVVFGLVSERCFEHKKYEDRKILYGHAQRLARARLPPLSKPHSFASQIPRTQIMDNADVISVI